MAYRLPLLGQQQQGIPNQTGITIGEPYAPQQGGPKLPQPPGPTQTPTPGSDLTKGSFGSPGVQPPAPDTSKPQVEITPFLKTIYDSMKNIDPETRSSYLNTTMTSIKERMDRYEFRLARGIPLTPEQQQQYNSLKSSFNDIQRFVNNPQAFDDYFRTAERNAARTPQGQAQRQIIPTPIGSASQSQYYRRA